MSKTSPNSRGETDLAQFIRDRGPHCLIIARHGETEWNAQRRLQGQRDVLLNKRGQSQALVVARFLRSVPLVQVHSSTLGRAWKTADSIAKININRPNVVCSDLLKETALGVLEGELIGRQSSAELSRYYRDFSRDEINYRVPDGENLHDVSARVQRFFADQRQLLEGPGMHLIVGHRNMNKMILKSLLGLSFEQGFRVEHEHQILYFYFGGPRELWSCRVGGSSPRFTPGYSTAIGGSYA